MTKVGLECKLYYNTGTYGTPTWVEIVNAKDVSFPASKGEAETSRRGSKFKTRRGTLIDLSIDFQLIYEPGDAVFAALFSAFLNSTPVELLALSGPVGTVGSEGWRATCEIFKNDGAQALESAETFDFSAKPTHSEHDPSWYVVED